MQPQPLLPVMGQLTTDRLILRPYRVEDSLAYFEMCLRNRNHLLPYEGGNPVLWVQSQEDATALLERFIEDWQESRSFFWGAWRKRDGAFTAQIYVGASNWELPEFEIGYFVNAAQQGQGFVTEGVYGIIAFLFDSIQAHRLTIRCNEMNTRSWQVAERCGFTREGHIRQTHKDILREDGSYSGDYIYGLLRSEYAATRGR